VLFSKYIYPEESPEPAGQSEQLEFRAESPTTQTSEYSADEPAAQQHLVTFTTLPPPLPPSSDTELRLEEAPITAPTIRTGDIQWTSPPTDATEIEPARGGSEWTSLYMQILSTAGYKFERQ